MPTSRKAMLFTAVPIIVVCLINIILEIVDPTIPGDPFGYGIAGLLGISIIAGIVFTVKSKKQVAKGIWRGTGIGLIVFILTFVILSVIESCQYSS